MKIYYNFSKEIRHSLYLDLILIFSKIKAGNIPLMFKETYLYKIKKLVS